MTGKTICGALFGGAVVLGYLQGMNTTEAPGIKDQGRSRAIESVQGLFNGFIKDYGDSDCQTLTGCNWSKADDRKRYFKEKVYKDKCYNYLKYVIAYCLDQAASMDKAKG